MQRAWNLSPVLQIVQEIPEKYCPSLYLLTKFGGLINCGSKMYPASYTNTHHDVTNLVNHKMVKNTKIWISWERNTTFLWNKKIINLCLRWHILRIYCFVAEVTFNCRTGRPNLGIMSPRRIGYENGLSNIDTTSTPETTNLFQKATSSGICNASFRK